ncbi:MAG: MAB_1171c family putative transporter [Labedaea sp.]
MTALEVFQGVVCYLVLALVLYLLVRAPRNVPLRAVTAMLVSFAAVFAFGTAASRGGTFLGLEPIMSRLMQHIGMVSGGFSLIAFFLFSALDMRAARRRALGQAVPVVLAVTIMTVSVGLMPENVEDAAAALTSGNPGGPVQEPTVGLFYLTANSYMVYAFGTALLWTRRYARGAEPRLRRGLALTAAGLCGMVFAESVFVVANVVRWAGGTMPHLLLMTAIMVILVGIATFLVGFAYPAVVMRLAALRIWSQHRRAYRRLAPLWTLLHQEFPEDALSRVPASTLGDAFRLRGVHRRYYRRVIECRDGLVRISPYVGQDGDHPLAERVRRGLRAHASSSPAPTRARPVAIPAGDGLDADVRELVALSDALRS